MDAYDELRSSDWFVAEWTSRVPKRMASSVTKLIRCQEPSCRCAFRPIEEVDQMAFIRCPDCRTSVKLKREFTPHQLGASSEYVCGECFREGKTVVATFRHNIGLVIVHLSNERYDRYCFGCLNKVFFFKTLLTICVGWIGLVSLLVAPIFVIQNIFNYLKAVFKAERPISSKPPLLSVQLFRFLDPHRDVLLNELESGVVTDRRRLSELAHSLGVLTPELLYYLEWLAWETAMKILLAQGQKVPAEVNVHLTETDYRLNNDEKSATHPMFKESRDRKYLLYGTAFRAYTPDPKLVRRAA